MSEGDVATMREAATLFSSDRRGISIDAELRAAVRWQYRSRYWCRSVEAGGSPILSAHRSCRERRGWPPASCLNGRAERRRRGRGTGEGASLALRGGRACQALSEAIVSARRPTWREIGVSSRREACRGDAREPYGGVAGGRGGSAAGRDLLRLLT